MVKLMKRRLTFKLTVLVLFLLPLSGCNFFDWIYSAEKSNDYELVYSEAEAEYRQGDFEKGLALFQRAVEIRSNSSEALYGCIKARLMISTDGLAITHFFAGLFQTSVAPLSFLTNLDSLKVVDIQINMQHSYEKLILIHDTNFSDSSLNKQSVSFLSDSIFVQTTVALLQLNDSNTNGIPNETEDLFLLEPDLTVITTNTNIATSEIINVIHILSNSQFILANATSLLNDLEAMVPGIFSTNSPWTALRQNATNSRANILNAIPIYEATL